MDMFLSAVFTLIGFAVFVFLCFSAWKAYVLIANFCEDRPNERWW